MLAKLEGVKPEDLKAVLKADAPQHAEEGLYLVYLWSNVDNPQEVLFLFRVDKIARAKQFIERVHTQALKENPDANLPQMTFLIEK
jgi:hypothetical protein